MFLVNVPILIAAFAGALVLVPGSKNPAAGRPDPWGAVLSITGLGLLLWAIIEAPARGWASAEVVGAGLASVVVLGAFVAWEARSSHPMLNLAFFADRRFSVAAAAESLGVFGLLGALFVQTQFLQFDLSFSPLQAGLRILPMAAVLGVSAPLSPILARVIGIKLTVAAGLAAIAGGLWQISAVSTAATTYGDVVPGLLLVGLGAGLLLPTATNSVVGSVPQGDSGIGSASNAVALQVGGALGVAVIGSVLATRYQDHMSAALAGRHVPAAAAHTILGSLGGALAVAAHAGGAAGALLAYTARAAFMSGTEIALAVGAAVALCGAVLVIACLPSRIPRDLPDPSVPVRRNRRHQPHPRAIQYSRPERPGALAEQSKRRAISSAGSRSQTIPQPTLATMTSTAAAIAIPASAATGGATARTPGRGRALREIRSREPGARAGRREDPPAAPGAHPRSARPALGPSAHRTPRPSAGPPGSAHSGPTPTASRSESEAFT